MHLQAQICLAFLSLYFHQFHKLAFVTCSERLYSLDHSKIDAVTSSPLSATIGQNTANIRVKHQLDREINARSEDT